MDEAKAESFYGMFDRDPEEGSGDPTGDAHGNAPVECFGPDMGGNIDGRADRGRDEETHQPEENESSSMLLGPMGGLQQKLQSLAAGGSLESAGLGVLTAEPKQRGSVLAKREQTRHIMRFGSITNGRVAVSHKLSECRLVKRDFHQDMKCQKQGCWANSHLVLVIRLGCF